MASPRIIGVFEDPQAAERAKETLLQSGVALHRIVVSGAGLKYIASAGLGALMGVIEEVRTNGGDIRLADLNETVRNIFEILGFNHLYRIFPTESEAIESFLSGGASL